MEFWRYPRFPDVVGDVLVLAGDICLTFKNVLEEFRKWLASVNVPVIYVFGNHEYYQADFETVPSQIKEFLKDLDHVHILDRGTVVIDGVTFIGATLWTNLGVRGEMIIRNSKMDIRAIKNFTIDKWNKSHRHDLDYITHVLENTKDDDTKKVIVTHHSPSYKSVSPRFINDSLNVGFHNSLEHLIIKYKPEIWIHGHTHDPMDYVISNTRVLCNPMGYPLENLPEGFSLRKVVYVLR